MIQPTTRFLKLACAFLVFASVLHAAAEDWAPAFSENFDKGWLRNWNLAGSVGPTNEDALVSGGRELTAKLDRRFTTAAVRVECDAEIIRPAASGEISDLSIFVGPVLFQFGGEYNTKTVIRHDPESSADSGVRIKHNTTYQLRAEVNGRLCRFTIDGADAGQLLLKAAPKALTVKLYSWAGTAKFDNLRILAKTSADPLPPELERNETKGTHTVQTLKQVRDWTLPEQSAPRASTVRRKRVALTVDVGSARTGMQWPVTVGIPFPRDTLWDSRNARIVTARGREIPSQRTVTATWSREGSIRWMLFDFPITVTDPAPKLFVEYGRRVRAAKVKKPIRIARDDKQISVTTGPARFVFSTTRGTVLESAHLDADEDGAFSADEQVLMPCDAYYTTAQGGRYQTGVADDELSVAVETAGPLRTVIRSRGWYLNNKGERACSFSRRIYLYQGLPWVRIFTTWTITVDTRVFTFSDVGLKFSLAAAKATQAAAGSDSETPVRTQARPDNPLLVVAAGHHKGFVETVAGRLEQTDVAGWIDLGDSSRGMTLACYEMSRQRPAALEATDKALVFHGYTSAAGHDLDMTANGLREIWGDAAFSRFENGRRSYPSLMNRNINGCGVAKTHELLLALHGGTSDAAAAIAFQSPPLVSADPVYVCGTGVVGPGPYHHYDPERFPKIEAAIEREFDRYVDVLDRLDPWVGWWDYGAGMPHYVVGHAEGPMHYNGYRRTYDLGYQRPLVPWQYYLRSGQRKWYAQAIRNARCMMDIRTCHWTNVALNKKVGHTTCSGAWGWDSYNASLGFNNYLPYLLMNYYTTGYERAMDVFIEVMAAYCRQTRPGGGSDYCGVVGTWLGNAAAAWRATWDDRYFAYFKSLESRQIRAVCKLCKGLKVYHLNLDDEHKHGESHRAGWRESGFMEAAQAPEQDPGLDQVFADWGATVRPAGLRTDYQTLGFSVVHSFQNSGNMLDAKWGEITSRNYSELSLTGNSGLSHLRSLPAAMKLALTPGLDQVKLPVSQRLPFPVYLKHGGGHPRTVVIKLNQQGKALRDAPSVIHVTGPNGKPIPQSWRELDWVWGKLTVTLPGDATAGVYVFTTREPGAMLDVSYPPGTPIMSGIPDGISYGRGTMPTLWFSVPDTVKRFRVRVNIPYRAVTVTLPDGAKIVGSKKRWHVIEVPADLPPGPWSVEVEHLHVANYILKLYDIPPLVAFDRESVFAAPSPPITAPDYVGEPDDAQFVQGPIPGKALLLNGRDVLKLPLGKLNGNRRERLNMQSGTIELFFKINENPKFARNNGIPLQVAPGPNTWKAGSGSVLTFQYKNHVSFLNRNGSLLRVAKFGPWDGGSPGMIALQPGRWYHLAVVWDYNRPVDIPGDPGRSKFLHRAFLDGKSLRHAESEKLQWFSDGFTAPTPGDVLDLSSHDHNIVIDELRVSDGMRREFDDAAYPVPTAPYEHDDQTLLLMHFDGNFEMSGENGQKIALDFVNKE